MCLFVIDCDLNCNMLREDRGCDEFRVGWEKTSKDLKIITYKKEKKEHEPIQLSVDWKKAFYLGNFYFFLFYFI